MARLQVPAAQLGPIHNVHGRSTVAWLVGLAGRSGDEQVISFDCDLDLLPEDRSALFALAAAGANG